MGEEIMKGALSYAAVRFLKDGLSAQEAAEKAVSELNDTLIKRNGYANPMSLIVLSRDGTYGIGTNITFTYCYASDREAAAVHEIVVERK